MVSLAAGGTHSCGVSESGDSYCWGYNIVGQIGSGSTEPIIQYSPTPVVGGLLFDQLTAGWRHSCGIEADGSAHCWGNGTRGQLGNGAFSHQTAPVAVSGGHSFLAVVEGRDHTCGIRDDRALSCWGSDQAGPF